MRLFLLCFLISSSVIAQLNASFIEVMFNPIEKNSEFIEIKNFSKFDSIDFSNWKIIYQNSPGDLIISPKAKLPPGGIMIIFENDYVLEGGVYQEELLKKSIVAKINDNSFGSVGMSNSSDRTLFLINSDADTLSIYTYSADNKKGISDEKIDLEGTNQISNWGNSLILNGTPGSINSISKKSYDVLIDSVYSSPQHPNQGEYYSVFSKIKNSGTYDAEKFFITFTIESEIENFKDSIFVNLLKPNDSLIVESNSRFHFSDSSTIIVKVNFLRDEFPYNDIFQKILLPSLSYNSILISEIQFNPIVGEPEWIEMYNNSKSIINIRDWQISDLLSKPHIIPITNENYNFPPNSYLVLCKNLDYFNSNEIELLKINRLPIFGNSEDGVVLYDGSHKIIDSSYYKNIWSSNKGVSIERIPNINSNRLLGDWTPSIDHNGNTAGKINSISNLPSLSYSDLIINEILYDPEAGNSEFVELYNPTAFPNEVASISLVLGSSIFQLTEKSHTLEAGGFFVIASDSTFLNYYQINSTSSPFVSVISNISLTNTGKEIKLIDLYGNTLDSLVYSPYWHDSNLFNTKNISLERLSPYSNSNSKLNWGSSASSIGATPLKINSISAKSISTKENIVVSPNPFSPDNDGYEDITTITIENFPSGSMYSILLFDSKGRKVRALANNKKLRSKSSLIFDGKDDDGNTLYIGVYVLLIQISSPDYSKSIKKALVIATKL